MPKFKCENTKCEKNNEEQLISGVKYSWNSETNAFESNSPVICRWCGDVMEEVVVKKSLSSINFSQQQQIKSSNSKQYKNYIY